jgi:hypothetical protein
VISRAKSAKSVSFEDVFKKLQFENVKIFALSNRKHVGVFLKSTILKIKERF